MLLIYADGLHFCKIIIKLLTKETIVCSIGTMSMQVDQGTEHPEAGS